MSSSTLPTSTRSQLESHSAHAAATVGAARGAAVRVPRQRELPFTRRAALLEASRDPKSGALTLMPVVAFGLDLFAISVALVGAAVGNQWIFESTGYVPSIAVSGPALCLAWLLSIAVAGGYDRHVFGSGAAEFNRVVNASLAGAALIGVGAFLLTYDLSRKWYVSTFLVGLPMLVLGRAALRFWTKRARANGLLQQRVLVVGDAAHVESIHAVLRRESWLGYHVIGALASPADGAATPCGIPILGDPGRVVETAQEARADIIVFAGGSVSSPSEMRDIAWKLEGSSIQVVMAPSLSDVSAERVKIRPVGGLPLIHLEPPRAALAARRAKRVFDVVGSSLILVLASPLLLFAAMRIRAHDGGPVLFRQERIGRDGVSFTCFKFRTMVTDAEAQLHRVHQELGSDADAMFYKLTRDPRITAPGTWLRRFSIDEVPQLWNVLRGDMSLVGPRPQVSHEVALYDSAMSRRLHVRPGMTGLWQVSGRSDLPLEEAVRLDLYYVDNWSMMQDLAILLRTLNAVVSSRGAY